MELGERMRMRARRRGGRCPTRSWPSRLSAVSSREREQVARDLKLIRGFRRKVRRSGGVRCARVPAFPCQGCSDVSQPGGSASGCLICLQSMVRSLGIIVRLTLRVNARVPFGLGFIGAQ